MKIFIATDSRGSHPLPKGGWSQKLIAKHPEHRFVTHRSSIETNSFTIYQLDPFLLKYPDGFFDLAFIQSGFNEGIEYWSERIFKSMIGKHFNPDALKKEIFDYKRRGGEAYIYVDREAEQRMFDLLKQKCKRVVFVGMHSNRSFRKNWYLPYDENTKEMLNVFSKLATDYVELPQTDEWVTENVALDGCHYNERGVKYIVEQLEREYF